MSLICGGRGPCCHVGYAHRHCEHCDVVIPTYACHHHSFGGWIPNWAGYYSTQTYASPLQAQLSGGLAGAVQQLSNQFNQLEEPQK